MDMQRCDKNYTEYCSQPQEGAQDAFLFSCCPTLHVIKGGEITDKNELVIRLISHRAFKRISPQTACNRF